MVLQNTSIVMPEHRRKRPTLSCLLCRKRKLRCDRAVPCSNCRKSRSGVCQYARFPDRSPTRSAEPITPSSLVQGEGSSAHQSPLARTEDQHCHELVPHSAPTPLGPKPSLQHKQIVDTGRRPDTVQEDLTCPLAGSWHVYSKVRYQKDKVVSGFVHKTRYFGPSHWAVSGVTFTLDVYNRAAGLVAPSTIQSAIDIVAKCKTLARTIKSRRNPTWPCPPTMDLPPKQLADALLHCYNVSSEGILRILHMPTFMKDYEDLFAGSKQDLAFCIQVKLVLAIGAIVYDDTFSLRTSATRWVYEAQCWLSEPKFKSRLALQGLQTQALLILAHERIGIGGDPSFISAGALMRKAMHMGLHKDPKHLPKKSLLSSEMRRRIWNTILEMNVQSSINTGAPALLTPDDFDTEPPGNYDDDQLMDDANEPASPEIMTQTTIAITLRESFNARLAVAKYLNDIRSDVTYDETLEHDTTIKTAYKSAVRKLQQAATSAGYVEDYAHQVRMVELVLLRYLMALHAPYHAASMQSIRYAYTRKAIVDCSFRAWSIMMGQRQNVDTPQTMQSMTPMTADLLYRSITCGSGCLPTIAQHACHLLAVECRALLEEQDSFGLPEPRQDLLSKIEQAKQWYFAGLDAGKVSVRGAQLLFIISAQIEALRRGIEGQEAAEMIISAAEKAALACLPYLERQAAALGTDEHAEAQEYQVDDFGQFDVMDDWGYLATQPTLLSGDDPWLLGYGEVGAFDAS